MADEAGQADLEFRKARFFARNCLYATLHSDHVHVVKKVLSFARICHTAPPPKSEHFARLALAICTAQEFFLNVAAIPRKSLECSMHIAVGLEDQLCPMSREDITLIENFKEKSFDQRLKVLNRELFVSLIHINVATSLDWAINAGWLLSVENDLELMPSKQGERELGFVREVSKEKETRTKRKWKRPRPGRPPQWLGEAAMYLDKHEMKDAQIARELDLSPSTLSENKHWKNLKARAKQFLPDRNRQGPTEQE